MDIVRKQSGENTRAVHLPAPPTPSQPPLGTPVFRTAAFAFGTADEYRAVLNDEMPGYTYSRIDNPTVDAFARAVAALEGVNLPRWPAAQAFASGMAAISGVFWTFARTGAHVVASSAVYGGTYALLTQVFPGYGIATTFVEPEAGAVGEAIGPVAGLAKPNHTFSAMNFRSRACIMAWRTRLSLICSCRRLTSIMYIGAKYS